MCVVSHDYLGYLRLGAAGVYFYSILLQNVYPASFLSLRAPGLDLLVPGAFISELSLD